MPNYSEINTTDRPVFPSLPPDLFFSLFLEMSKDEKKGPRAAWRDCVPLLIATLTVFPTTTKLLKRLSVDFFVQEILNCFKNDLFGSAGRKSLPLLVSLDPLLTTLLPEVLSKKYDLLLVFDLCRLKLNLKTKKEDDALQRRLWVKCKKVGVDPEIVRCLFSDLKTRRSVQRRHDLIYRAYELFLSANIDWVFTILLSDQITAQEKMWLVPDGQFLSLPEQRLFSIIEKGLCVNVTGHPPSSRVLRHSHAEICPKFFVECADVDYSPADCRLGNRIVISDPQFIKNITSFHSIDPLMLPPDDGQINIQCSLTLRDFSSNASPRKDPGALRKRKSMEDVCLDEQSSMVRAKFPKYEMIELSEFIRKLKEDFLPDAIGVTVVGSKKIVRCIPFFNEHLKFENKKNNVEAFVSEAIEEIMGDPGRRKLMLWQGFGPRGEEVVRGIAAHFRKITLGSLAAGCEMDRRLRQLSKMGEAQACGLTTVPLIDSITSLHVWIVLSKALLSAYPVEDDAEEVLVLRGPCYSRAGVFENYELPILCERGIPARLLCLDYSKNNPVFDQENNPIKAVHQMGHYIVRSCDYYIYQQNTIITIDELKSEALRCGMPCSDIEVYGFFGSLHLSLLSLLGEGSLPLLPSPPVVVLGSSDNNVEQINQDNLVLDRAINVALAGMNPEGVQLFTDCLLVEVLSKLPPVDPSPLCEHSPDFWRFSGFSQSSPSFGPCFFRSQPVSHSVSVRTHPGQMARMGEYCS